jgi:hypothetical protein
LQPAGNFDGRSVAIQRRRMREKTFLDQNIGASMLRRFVPSLFNPRLYSLSLPRSLVAIPFAQGAWFAFHHQIGISSDLYSGALSVIFLSPRHANKIRIPVLSSWYSPALRRHRLRRAD